MGNIKSNEQTKHDVNNWNANLFTHYDKSNSLRRDPCAQRSLSQVED